MNELPQLHLGRGTHRGPLSLFPIWWRGTPEPTVSLASEDALSVSELAQATVPHLEVKSNSADRILLLDGDLLIGGRQNRMAIGSTVIPPGEKVTIHVRCVEQERWAGAQRHTYSTERSSSYVRGTREQGEVWRRIARERRRNPQPIDVSGLEPFPGQTGVLIGFGGHPALLEVFSHPSLFADVWGRILRSAAREAAWFPVARTPGRRARRFVKHVERMEIKPVSNGNSTVTYMAKDDHLEARVLTDDETILHVSVLQHRAGPNVAV